jgi:para-nitrobenzyl esterase
MRRILACLTTVALALIANSAAWAQEVCAAPAATAQGAYTGLTDPAFPACVYRGIPFAQPPVGALRLARPVPPSAHEGVAAADKFGPACLQEPSMLNGGEAESYEEDCLYLNVWRPAKSGRLPVMVWIYGGGFMGGAGSFNIYDGAHLATREDVVIVTFNYRLGALGWMALPELKAEDIKGSTGNYGMYDQVRALEWVRDNIANFGGDPGNVTVFGQSAGAMSICALLASPESGGLFHKAMMMSGPCRLMTTLDEGYAKSQAYAKSIGCDGPDLIACLRAKPTAAFNTKAPNDMFNGGTAWSPTIDGVFLPDFPVTLIQQGKYHHVPVMISTTRDELRMYTMMIPGLGAWSRGTVRGLMKTITGPNQPELMALYDFNDYRRPIDLAISFGNQMVFDTPEFMMAEAMSPNNPVHLYRFDWDKTRMPHKMAAFHAIDVPFVFGAFNMDVKLAKLMADKKTIAKASPIGYTMMDYVGNFTRTGDPNGPNLSPWPAYTTKDRERMYITTDFNPRPLTDKEIARYQWFATRTLRQVLVGNLSSKLAEKK